MNFKMYFSFLFVLFLANCTTTKSFALFDSKISFEDFRNQWPSRMAQIKNRQISSELTWQAKLNLLCQNHENLCETRSKASTKVPKKTDLNHQVYFKTIQESQYSGLESVSTAYALKAFGRLKKEKLMQYSENLLNDTSCFSTDSRHALAATLENFLPDQEVLYTTLSLFEANTKCPHLRTAALSAYRAGMLRIVDNRCDVAIPLLEQAAQSSEEYLKSRSLYWKWSCLGQSPVVKSEALSSMPYFSYHRLIINQFSDYTLSDQELSQNQTPFELESKDLALNQMLNLIESLIANNDLPSARFIFEKVNMNRLQEVEPGFRLHWAYLMHLSQSGVRKFQILSKLINTSQDFRTKSVKSMLFPNWYFESVSFHTSQVDPWLIQSLIRQESAFDPRARSSVGATGLMQLMPSTARRMAKINRSQLADPAANVKLGVRFFEHLLKRYDGETHLALAAYNAGPGKVDEWIKRYPTENPLLFVDAIPYRETREYVSFIMRNYYWYKFLNGVNQSEPSQVSEFDPMASSDL